MNQIPFKKCISKTLILTHYNHFIYAVYPNENKQTVRTRPDWRQKGQVNLLPISRSDTERPIFVRKYVSWFHTLTSEVNIRMVASDVELFTRPCPLSSPPPTHRTTADDVCLSVLRLRSVAAQSVLSVTMATSIAPLFRSTSEQRDPLTATVTGKQ